MDALAGPVYVAGALLALAGGAKLTRPAPTAGALRALHLPGPSLGVRVLGAGEILLGTAAVVTGASLLVALVAVAYVAFTAFVLAAMRAGTDIQSCGCFGMVDTPPSSVHVVLDGVLCLPCAGAAIAGLPPLSGVIGDQDWLGIPFVALVAVAVYLAYLVLTVLPQVSRASSDLAVSR